MKTNHYLVSLLILLMLGSCNDLLIEEPVSYYKKENFFTSIANAEMSIIGT